MNLGHSVQFRFPRLYHHSRLVFCARGIQFGVRDCHNLVSGKSKLPYDDFSVKGLA